MRTALTEKQRQVLALLASGKTNAEIAERLGVSLDGAKWHVREIFSRLGVDSREEASEWWRQNRGRGGRLPGWLPWPAWIAAGSLAALATAVAVAVILAPLADDAPGSAVQTGAPSVSAVPPATATATPAALAPKAQPALVEVATGESWRLLRADDGLPLPAVADAILAITWDRPTPTIDILDVDGRIAARVEVGYRPMAHLNATNGTLVVSDSVSDGGTVSRPRILVFDLAGLRLVADISLLRRRLSSNVFVDVIALSSDGRFAYWFEHNSPPDPAVCGPAADPNPCDFVVHAVDLGSLAPTPLSAPLPRNCTFPSVGAYVGSSVIAECGRRFIIDAAQPTGADAVEAPDSIPRGLFDYNVVLLGDVALRRSQNNVGTFTRIVVVDVRSGATRADQPLTDVVWGVTLIDDQTALLLRSDGTLARMALATGTLRQLPYRIDPGGQGGDVALVR